MSGPTAFVPARRGLIQAERVYIQLGRTGDAIASVPLCWMYWKETGKKCALMVHREFSSFLEGISYIVPEIWDGDWRDVKGAMRHCQRKGYQQVINAQIYGHGLRPGRTTSSFILESWAQVGRLKDWPSKLVFDNRNFDREAKLAEPLPRDKPVVLVAADGISSPFPHKEKLMQLLRDACGDSARVVDLKDYRTPHFHDFLGLFDRAACLVTCDTGFGQLAVASSIPVCALAAYKPTTWHSAPQRKQHLCYIRYNQFESRKHELVKAVESCISKSVKPYIVHVWAGVGMAGDSLRRHETARETWLREAKDYGRWIDRQYQGIPPDRTAKDIGDPVSLPFIHDMMLYGQRCAVGDDAILLITNADICMVPGLADEIALMCRTYGATYCHRWDFPKVVTHIERHQITQGGKWYVGCDLFAVTIGWWKKHKSQLPPFVLGRECWDWVFRLLIEETGGRQIEKGIYHEKHSSPWEVQRGLGGNLHNRSHARAWLKKRKIPLAEIENLPFIEV